MPVSRDERGRSQQQQQDGRRPSAASIGRSGRGAAGQGAATVGASAGRAIGIRDNARSARRASTNARAAQASEGTQAPWRSSLDLVWSYSRSQAFYGANIATSPSFVEHRWAGPSNGLADSSVEEEDEDEDDSASYGSDEYDDEVGVDDLEASASSLNYAVRSRPAQMSKYGAADVQAHDDDIVAASPAAPMDWQDEQLPPNAVQRGDGSSKSRAGGVLGRRDKRRSMARSPRDPERRVLDRRLRRLADDAGDDERSRSRSRSPKRVNVSRPSASGLSRASYHSDEDDEEDELGTRDGKAIQDEGRQQRSAQRSVGFLPTDRPSEATPLLRKARGDFMDNDTADRGESGPRSQRQSLLRTPSWFRHSHVSTSSSKFQRQGYGTSTFWQSWFNTVNALVGVGILSLPLAISYAGLIPGIILFLLCGLVTNYTGKVLAHIMAAEPALRTYADIGNLAFGPKARLLVSFFFCLELWAVSTALVILFGDSVHALVLASAEEHIGGSFVAHLASWPVAAFKALGVLIVLPTMFLPLRLLSPVSVVGIISVVTLFAVVLADGIIKPHAPGSLRDPIPPHLGPQWMRLPLSFGLIMSGFSSHPIIPSLFKDMRNPKQFSKMLNWAYIGATIIYLGMGLIGYLMFGQHVSDEITRNLAQTKGYPRALNTIALWLIIVNPLSKFALAARPVVTTLELLFGVEQSQLIKQHDEADGTTSTQSSFSQKAVTPASGTATDGLPLPSDGRAASPMADDALPQHDGASSELSEGATTPRGDNGTGPSPLVGSAISLRAAQRTARWSKPRKVALRTAIQVLVTVMIGLTAVVLPGFEKVMAFLGAFLACATCIFGPLLARMRLFRHEMSRTHILCDVVILGVSVIVAALGTVWTFISSSAPVKAL